MKSLLFLVYIIAFQAIYVTSAAPASVPYVFAFPEEFSCKGFNYNDPRQFRLKCIRSVPRQMKCACFSKGKGIAFQLSCSCNGATNNTGAAVDLFPQFSEPIETVGLYYPDVD